MGSGEYMVEMEEFVVEMDTKQQGTMNTTKCPKGN